jgi:uncharacterized membrane protein YbjE (DUF340 family)
VIKYVLTALIVGAIAGYLVSYSGNSVTGGCVVDYLFNGSLLVLLFAMGLSFGLDEAAIRKLRQIGLRILVVPLAVVLGSILGGLVGGLILRLDLSASMAVTAGYGWYTIDGPMVGQIFGAEWGAMGFAVNFIRELLTIVTITLLVKISKYAPIASGGATTMDTTLPVIVRYCGPDALITAFSSGFMLSLLAPFSIVAVSTLGRTLLSLMLF